MLLQQSCISLPLEIWPGQTRDTNLILKVVQMWGGRVLTTELLDTFQPE